MSAEKKKKKNEKRNVCLLKIPVWFCNETN